MEDHIFEPVTSALPHKSSELSLWPDKNSVPDLHALDFDRPRSRAVFICVPWNAWSIRVEFGAGQKSSAANRVLELGWRVYYYGAAVFPLDAGRPAGNPQIAEAIAIRARGASAEAKYPNITIVISVTYVDKETN